MFRLACFLTALLLSSATAHPGLGLNIKGLAGSVKDKILATFDKFLKVLASIGDGVCEHVKPFVGEAYESYDKEPDMGKLTLVHITR